MRTIDYLQRLFPVGLSYQYLDLAEGSYRLGKGRDSQGPEQCRDIAVLKQPFYHFCFNRISRDEHSGPVYMGGAVVRHFSEDIRRTKRIS